MTERRQRRKPLRRRDELALQQSEARFRQMIETAHEGVVVLNADGAITYTNPRALEMLRYREAELVGTPVFACVHESSRALALASFDRRRRGIRESFEVRFLAKDGTSCWGLVSATPITDAEGRFVGSFSMITDVTRRKQAEEELRRSNEVLRESKERLEKTFRSLDSALFVLDESNPPVILDCNPAASRIFGYQREEMLGSTTAFLHADARALAEFQRANSAALAAQGMLSGFEFRMKRNTGEVFPTEHSVLPLNDDRGRRTGWVSVVNDISARKRVELEETRLRAALTRSADEWSKTFDAMEEAILILDANCRVLRLNRAAAQLAGWSFQDSLGVRLQELGPGDPWARPLPCWPRRDRGGRRCGRYARRRADAPGTSPPRTWPRRGRRRATCWSCAT